MNRRLLSIAIGLILAVVFPPSRQGAGADPATDGGRSMDVAPNGIDGVASPTDGGEGSAAPITQPAVDAEPPAPARVPARPWAVPVVEPTPEQAQLKQRLRECLAYYFQRPEDNSQRSPWGVMHAIVGFGVDTPLRAQGQTVNAIAWLCANAPCYNMRLMRFQHERLGVNMGPGYQGHQGQWLCILAQSRVQRDYPLIVEGRALKVADLIEQEQWTCEAGTELTFKLIGLSYYLKSDAIWRNQRGEEWDLPRLIREELAQPIVGAACGGTHRLMGLSYAVRERHKDGLELTGQWQRAERFLADFHEYTFRLQNADGSFSTAWFERRDDRGTRDRRLDTTGHILEWLVYSLSREQLDDPRVTKGLSYLVDLMWQYRAHPWEIGPKGHALHALAMYDERVFGGQPGRRAEELTK